MPSTLSPKIAVLTAFPKNNAKFLPNLEEEEKTISGLLKNRDEIEHLNLKCVSIDGLINGLNEVGERLGILHFGGHAGGTHLQLEDSPANIKGLIPLIREHNHIPIVFLNACSTKGQIEQFTSAGVSAVIATTTLVDDNSAYLFAKRFYDSFLSGTTLQKSYDVAVNKLKMMDRNANHQTEMRHMNIPEHELSEDRSTDWVITINDPNLAEVTIGELWDYLCAKRVYTPYMHWIRDRHARIAINGIDSHPPINLEKIFVSLKGELSQSYEIHQAQKLYEEDKEELEKTLEDWDIPFEEKQKKRTILLGRSALMPALEEQAMRIVLGQTESLDHNLAEVVARRDHLVILGDPGTGKTTLAQWLVLQHAVAAINEQDTISIPLNRVSSKSNQGGDVDLGQVRLPILVQVGEFAEKKRKQKSLCIADFLGGHRWKGHAPIDLNTREQLDPNYLHRMMLNYIRQGKALIILDGLDEISEESEREEIVKEVRDFLIEKVESPIRENLKYRNKFIITSRIAGYHIQPVTHPSIHHLTIQPMADRAVKHFCKTWLRAAHQEENPHKKERQVAFEAMELQLKLVEMIFDPTRTGVRDLASNPLLLTELCITFKKKGQQLPNTRVELYKTAAENFFRVWNGRMNLQKKDTEFLDQKMFYILEDIAEYIHLNYPSGLIPKEQVYTITLKSIRRFNKKHEIEPQITATEEADLFLKVIREEVGLLASKAEALFGFLHLTFEEYFAARKLIREPDLEKLQNSIVEKAYLPRWREPLMMAIGSLSEVLIPEDIDLLLENLMDREDPMKNLVPRSANLIAQAFPEMKYKPDSNLIQQVARKLIESYAETNNREDAEPLRSNVRGTLNLLRNNPRFWPHVANLFQLILDGNNTQAPLRNAVADILLHGKAPDRQEAQALLKSAAYDSSIWKWPHHQLLVRIANTNPDYLDARFLEFKAFLLEFPEYVSIIRQHRTWARIVYILYGAVVSEKKNNRTTYAFSPHGIIHDSFLTPEIIEALEDGEPPESLMEFCYTAWRSEGQSLKNRVDAVLYLAATGKVRIEELRALTEERESGLFAAVLHRLDRLQSLFGAYIATVTKNNPEGICELVKGMDQDFIERFISGMINLAGSFHEKAASPIIWIEAMPKNLQSRTLAEVWVYGFKSDDAVYNISVMLDTLGDQLRKLGPMVVAESFAEVSRVISPPPYQLWAIDRVPYNPRNEQDILSEALANLSVLSSGFDMLRYWALREMKPKLLEHRELRPYINGVVSGIRQPGFREAAFELFQEEGGTIFLIIPDEDDSDPMDMNARNRSEERMILDWSIYKILERGLLRIIQATEEELWEQPEKWLREIFRFLSRDMSLDHIPTEQEGQSIVESLHDIALNLIALLESPADKVKGYVKLAALVVVDQETRDNKMVLALEAVAQIPPSRQLASSLREISPWIISSPKLEQWYNKERRRLDTPLLQADIENRLYPYFLNLPPSIEDNDQLALLSIGALIRDGLIMFTLPNSTEELWERSFDLEGEELAELVQKMIDIGRKTPMELSLLGALAISNLLKKGQNELVCQLIPAIGAPVFDAIRLVAEWLEIGDPVVQTFAAVLILETGRMNKDIYPHLERAMFSRQDGVFDQLHKRVHLGLTKTYFGARADSYDYLMMMAKSGARYRKTQPYLSLGLNWYFEHLVIENDDLLNRIIETADGKTSKARYAQYILKKINFISGLPTFQALMVGLHHSNPEIVRRLLVSVRTILYRQGYYSVAPLRRSWQKKVLEILLEKASESDDPDIQSLAIDAIGYYRKADPDVAAFLKDIAQNGPAPQNAIALGALSQRNFLIEEAFIKSFLDHEDQSLRIAAAEVICRYYIGVWPDEKEEVHRLKELLRGDEKLLLEGILASTRGHWWGVEMEKCGRFLEYYFQEFQNEGQFEQYMHRAVPILRESLAREEGRSHAECTWENQIAHNTPGMHTEALFQGALHHPSTFILGSRRFADFEAMMANAAMQYNSFVVRKNAIHCISLRRKMTLPVSIEAYCAALRDVYYVVSEAINSTFRFRDMDQQFIQELSARFDQENSSTKYAMVNILTAIAADPKTLSEVQQQILALLREKLNDPRNQDHVYILWSDKGSFDAKLVYKGRLDNHLYRKILEVTGITPRTLQQNQP